VTEEGECEPQEVANRMVIRSVTPVTEEGKCEPQEVANRETLSPSPRHFLWLFSGVWGIRIRNYFSKKYQ
jgi:hypothetical protein